MISQDAGELPAEMQIRAGPILVLVRAVDKNLQQIEQMGNLALIASIRSD